MFTTRLNALKASGPAAIGALLASGLLVFANPMLGHAQQTMNAQPLTPDTIAVSAADLGPEWSVASHQGQTLDDGTPLSNFRYSAASGRQVLLTTALAPNPDYTEEVLTYLRYQVEKDGATVSSVQSNGFGDGRAFKAESHGSQMMEVASMFRVRNLIALIGYVGPAWAGDVETQALANARKQEARLFAFFAPPPAPTAAPTPAPAVASTPAPTPAPTAPATVGSDASSPGALHTVSPARSPSSRSASRR